MSKNKLLSSYLDFVRFFAALLVVFGHAKLHAFGQGKVGDPIVFVTSAFPHLAVIIFFVISGYLVGGKLYSAGKEGFGPKYLLDRATRIYTVALPMMVIGFAIMLIQQYLYGHAFQLTGSDCRATAADLAGSMLFIHGAFMPTPCFNGPFWSLIYEVFYYLFFFGVALALSTHGRTRYIAAAAAVVLGLYGLFEPQELYAYSTIWLVGMVIAHPEPLRGRQLVFTATVIFLFVLQALLRLHDPEMKWEVPATLLMVGSILLLRRWQPFDLPPLVARIFALGAAMSYSLYLAHAPAMNLLRGVAQGSFGIRPSYGAFILAGSVAGVACWWLFERHTMAIRLALEKWAGIARPEVHQPIPANKPIDGEAPLPAREATQV